MSKLDLNNAGDFARATMQNASLAVGFGGANAQPALEWEIFEGGYVADQTLGGRSPSLTDDAYKLFHVFISKRTYQAGLSTINDKGGRRVARYKFPYRDGQTTDDLGRQPEDFSINCVIHGDRYLEAFYALLDELHKPTPGTLRHPVRGLIRVRFLDYDITHDQNTRKAVAFVLNFTEHNYSIGEVGARSFRTTFKDRVAKSTSSFAKVTAALDRIQTFNQRTRQRLGAATALLNSLNVGLSFTIPSLAITFLQGADGITDIPGLLPLNSGGTGSASESLFPIATSPDDPFISIPTADISTTTQTALASENMKKQVNERRTEVSACIAELEAFDGGDGALEFFEEVKSLREIAIDLQETLEAGLQSSSARVVKYVTPRIMNLREIAFEFGQSPDRCVDIDLLNPQLESTNFIAKGIEVKVPIE